MSRYFDPHDAFLRAKADNAFEKFVRAYRVKFDPDQPRDELGQWTAGNAGANVGSTVGSSIMTDFSAARRGQSEAVCWSQYTIDLLRCGSELRPAAREICRGQAMERYAACRSGRPIPPLIF